MPKGKAPGKAARSFFFKGGFYLLHHAFGINMLRLGSTIEEKLPFVAAGSHRGNSTWGLASQASRGLHGFAAWGCCRLLATLALFFGHGSASCPDGGRLARCFMTCQAGPDSGLLRRGNRAGLAGSRRWFFLVKRTQKETPPIIAMIYHHLCKTQARPTN